MVVVEVEVVELVGGGVQLLVLVVESGVYEGGGSWVLDVHWLLLLL